ncbi:MAG TPA: glutamate ABC transporter substrate-binding protein [Burkholderiaceae bacterium]|nr:glutamate ABC transporter substrate-binding protein [Burkholderiaceae bacterium]
MKHILWRGPSRAVRLSAVLVALSCSGLIGMGVAYGASTGAAPTFPKDSTMAKIQARGKLVVGVKYDVPTFGQKNPITGAVEGFEPELAKILGRDMFGADGHVEFVEAPGPSRETIVQQGRADLVSSTYTITPEREKAISFAGPIYVSTPAIMVRKDYKGLGDSIPGYQALNGHSVCAVTNSIESNLLSKKAPNAKIIHLTSNAQCVKALEQGRVDTYATDDVIIFGFLKKEPHKFRFVANPNGEKQPYGIGVKKSSKDLCEWVNKELLVAFQDGSWKKAFADTIGKVVSTIPEPPTAADMHYCD